MENDYTQCDLGSKWSEAQTNLVNASNDQSGAMYTTYTSANCAPFGADPADMAGGYGGGTGVNQDLLTYLDGGNLTHTGVVLTDYPGHALIDGIIGRNPGVALADRSPRASAANASTTTTTRPMQARRPICTPATAAPPSGGRGTARTARSPSTACASTSQARTPPTAPR